MAIKLHYEIYGTGKPLVLLHGNGDSSYYFKYQIESFSKYFKVITVDTRGHGKSPRGSAPFTLNQFADDLKNLLDSLDIKKANILGFSDGGNIALIFTLKYPEYTDRLILNGANIFPTGLRVFFHIPVLVSYASCKVASKFISKAVGTNEMLGLMVNEPHIRVDELQKIRSRTLVIAGTFDLIKKKHTLLIANSIPNAKVMFIKGSHSVARDNYQEYNKAVLDFLK